jgi:hypothetical protein
MKNLREEDFSIRTRRGYYCGEQNLKVYISKYYKSLFGPPEKKFFHMFEIETSDIP